MSKSPYKKGQPKTPASLEYEGSLFTFDEMPELVKSKIMATLHELEKMAIEQNKDISIIEKGLADYKARVTKRQAGSTLGSLDFVYYTPSDPVMKCRSRIDLAKRLGLYAVVGLRGEITTAAAEAGVALASPRNVGGARTNSILGSRVRKAAPKSLAQMYLDDDFELLSPMRVSRYTVVTKLGKIDKNTSVKNNKLYPIGFTSRTLFPSPAAPTKDIVYECVVEPGPKFVIRAVGGPKPIDIVIPTKVEKPVATPAKPAAVTATPNSKGPSKPSSAPVSTSNGNKVPSQGPDSPSKKKSVAPQSGSYTPIKPSTSTSGFSAFRAVPPVINAVPAPSAMPIAPVVPVVGSDSPVQANNDSANASAPSTVKKSEKKIKVVFTEGSSVKAPADMPTAIEQDQAGSVKKKSKSIALEGSDGKKKKVNSTQVGAAATKEANAQSASAAAIAANARKAPFEDAAERNRIEPETISDKMLRFGANGSTPQDAWTNLVYGFESRVCDLINRLAYMSGLPQTSHIEESCALVLRGILDDVEFKLTKTHRPSFLVNEELKTYLGDFMFGFINSNIVQLIHSLPGAEDAIRLAGSKYKKPNVEPNWQRISKEMEKKVARSVINFSEKFRLQEEKAERACDRKMRSENNLSRAFREKLTSKSAKDGEDNAPVKKVKQPKTKPPPPLPKKDASLLADTSRRVLALQFLNKVEADVKEKAKMRPTLLEDFNRTVSTVREFWDSTKLRESDIVVVPETAKPEVFRAWQKLDARLLSAWDFCSTFAITMGICSPQALAPFVAGEVRVEDKLVLRTRASAFRAPIELDEFLQAFERADEKMLAPIFTALLRLSASAVFEYREDISARAEMIRKQGSVWTDPDDEFDMFGAIVRIERTLSKDGDVAHYLVDETPICEATWFDLARACFTFRTRQRTNIQDEREGFGEPENEAALKMLDDATTEDHIAEATRLIFEEEKKAAAFVASIEEADEIAVEDPTDEGKKEQSVRAPVATAAGEEVVDERTNLTIEDDNNNNQKEDEEDDRNGGHKKKAAWTEVVQELKSTPSNRARKMKDLVEKAIKLVPRQDRFARQILKDALSYYQSSNASRMRDRALEALKSVSSPTKDALMLKPSEDDADGMGGDDDDESENDSSDDEEASGGVPVRPMTPLDSHCLRVAVQTLMKRPNVPSATHLSLKAAEFKLSSGMYVSAKQAVREIQSYFQSSRSTRASRDQSTKELIALEEEFTRVLDQICRESGVSELGRHPDTCVVHRAGLTRPHMLFSLYAKTDRDVAFERSPEPIFTAQLPFEAISSFKSETVSESKPTLAKTWTDRLFEARTLKDLVWQDRVELLTRLVDFAVEANEIRQEMRAREAEVEKVRAKFGHANQLYSMAGAQPTELSEAEKQLTAFMSSHQLALEALGEMLAVHVETVKRDVREEQVARKKHARTGPLRAELDRLLAGYEVRPKIIGVDRFGRAFLHFPGAPCSLFVVGQTDSECYRVSQGFDDLAELLLDSEDAREQALGAVVRDMLPVLKDDPQRPSLHVKVPEPEESIATLLKRPDQKHNTRNAGGLSVEGDLGEQWLDVGYKVGDRVGREFPFEGAASTRSYRVGGFIAAFLPAEGEDPALWKMIHDDGDAEDLEVEELEAGLKTAQSPFATQAGFYFPYFPDSKAREGVAMSFAKMVAEKAFSTNSYESKRLLDLRVTLLCMEKALHSPWPDRPRFQFTVLHSRTWQGLRGALAMFERDCRSKQLINPDFDKSFPPSTSAWTIDTPHMLACRILCLDRNLLYPSKEELVQQLKEKREKEMANERAIMDEQRRSRATDRKRKLEEEKHKREEEAKRQRQRRNNLGLRQRSTASVSPVQSASDDEEFDEPNRGGRISRQSSTASRKKSRMEIEDEEEQPQDEEDEEQVEEEDEVEEPEDDEEPADEEEDEDEDESASEAEEEDEEGSEGDEDSDEEEDEEEDDEDDEDEEEAPTSRRPTRAAKPANSGKSGRSGKNGKDSFKELSAADQRAIRAARRG